MFAPPDGPSGLPSRRFLSFMILTVALLGAPNPARAEFRAANSPISACAGTYTDTGGPSGNYGNNESIVQTIWPSLPNTRVALSFTSFLTESGWDTLTIHNGHDLAAPSIPGAWSGSVPPQTITSTAADGSLTVRWISDLTGFDTGWEAGISCLPAEQRQRNELDYVCDGSFTDSGGPDAPYASFETYLLRLYPTHAGDRLEVNFTAFDTESFDILYVYDGSTTSDPLLGTFSGSALPPTLRATNSSGALTFRFNSDGTVVGNGWRAAFNCAHRIEGPVTTAVTSCSGTAVDSGGSGGNYSDNEYFVQTFLPEDPAAKIELWFSTFATQAPEDWLDIYDGSNTASPFLGSFSGSSSPGIVTSSAGDGALTFVWFSDGASTQLGWVANVSCVYPIASGFISTCSAISTDSGGRAGDYENSESFVQTFQRSRPWSRMRADVFNFSSELDYDFLKIRDGAASAPILGTLTGSPALPVGWVAPNLPGQLTLDWISDFSNIGAGWNALVRCELPLFADGFEGRDLAQWSVAVP